MIIFITRKQLHQKEVVLQVPKSEPLRKKGFMVLVHLREKITGLRREEGAHKVATLNVVGKINDQRLRLDDFFSRWENRQTLAFGA